MPHFLDKSHPNVWKSVNAFSETVSQAAASAGLSQQELELLKVHASQLNGCAYCLDLHSRLAREVGVPQQKLDMLIAWRDSLVYTKRELALLCVAQAATQLPLTVASRMELEDAACELGDQAFAAAQWVSITINTFNRISILSHHPVRERDAEGKIVK